MKFVVTSWGLVMVCLSVSVVAQPSNRAEPCPGVIQCSTLKNAVYNDMIEAGLEYDVCLPIRNVVDCFRRNKKCEDTDLFLTDLYEEYGSQCTDLWGARGDGMGARGDGMGARGDGMGARGDGMGARGDGMGARGDGMGARGDGMGARGDGMGARGDGMGARGDGMGARGDGMGARGPRGDGNVEVCTTSLVLALVAAVLV